MDEKTFQRAMNLLSALHEQGVEYILVGGLAMAMHGLVRATEDIDLFISLSTEDNVVKLRAALSSVWDDPHIQEIVYDDLVGGYPVIRYGPPDEIFVVDLLARLGEMFTYEDLEAETKTVRGVPVRVATPRTLYRMKRNTDRARDRMDAQALLEIFVELQEEPNGNTEIP